VTTNGLTLEVLTVEGHRVTRLRVTAEEKHEAEANGNGNGKRNGKSENGAA
jgi:hypothetical protein